MRCHCGKLCKHDLGLRPHQRFCQINDVPELTEFFNKNLSENSLIEYDGNTENTFIPPNQIPKVGIKLPKSKEE